MAATAPTPQASFTNEDANSKAVINGIEHVVGLTTLVEQWGTDGQWRVVLTAHTLEGRVRIAATGPHATPKAALEAYAASFKIGQIQPQAVTT